MNSSLEKFVLEELSCPACFDYMCPPIKQCLEGHNICHECFNMVSICPKCRGKKSETARNYALESIFGMLNIPCKNQYMGCEFSSLGAYINEHQKYCWFKKNKCPFIHYDNCDWKDSMNNLKDHLMMEHSTNFYQKDRQKFVSQNFKYIDDYHYIFAILYVYGVYFRLTWDINDQTGMTRWAVYYMGGQEDAQRYYYKLEINKSADSRDTPVPLTFKSVCDAKPDKDKFKNHNCCYIHKSLLDQYCSSNGDLHYRVTIYSLDNNLKQFNATSTTIDRELDRKEKQQKRSPLSVIKEED